jgi:hypothetical protein
MGITPYLSIVAASRNDGHGGNILKRMQLFVSGLIAQSNRHNLLTELIIVEWNPPEDRPLLQDLLPKPQTGDKLTLRYIEVPPEIHKRYKRNGEIPLFQMIAKNVGIRRANGEFILCTNVDLLFSDELFRIIATKNFKDNYYYRANRCDVPDGIDMAWSLEKQLEWCSKNIIRRLGRDPRFKNINLEQFGLNDKGWLKKWAFDILSMRMKMFWPLEKRKYYLIDSFACGDFTMMAKKAWINIQGYVELDLYSIHIDTLGLIAASSLGYSQYIFPKTACTYHIDHHSGWESMSPLQKLRFLEERPGIDYSLIFETGQYALKKGGHLDLNPPDWGFDHLTFKEFQFPKI